MSDLAVDFALLPPPSQSHWPSACQQIALAPLRTRSPVGSPSSSKRSWRGACSGPLSGVFPASGTSGGVGSSPIR